MNESISISLTDFKKSLIFAYVAYESVKFLKEITSFKTLSMKHCQYKDDIFNLLELENSYSNII